MDFFEFLFVPTILFMVIVAPVWVALHYKSVNRASRSLSSEDRESVEQILVSVDKLAERIETLESLLDASHGDWREAEERQGERVRENVQGERQ
ncbi:MAG: envelope stress response membrane protein PspB [Pseudomonadota bacterium]